MSEFGGGPVTRGLGGDNLVKRGFGEELASEGAPPPPILGPFDRFCAGALLTRGLGYPLLVTRGLGFCALPTVITPEDLARPRQLIRRGGSGRRYEVRYDVDRCIEDPTLCYRIVSQLVTVNGKRVEWPMIEGDTGMVQFNGRHEAEVFVKQMDVNSRPVGKAIKIKVRLIKPDENN